MKDDYVIEGVVFYLNEKEEKDEEDTDCFIANE